jgi:hypothetical protein
VSNVHNDNEAATIKSATEGIELKTVIPFFQKEPTSPEFIFSTGPSKFDQNPGVLSLDVVVPESMI